MEDPYALSYDLKKQFSVAELNDYTTLFKAKDTSNDGSI
jgi:plastin-1